MPHKSLKNQVQSPVQSLFSHLHASLHAHPVLFHHQTVRLVFLDVKIHADLAGDIPKRLAAL